jgi:predicted enzyme related to lactoylglutathione lyase
MKEIPMPETSTKTGISHVAFVTINVSDVERAIVFYTDALGFKKTTDATMGKMRWIELTPPGNTTRVTLLSEGNPAFEAERVGNQMAATFEVNDIEATCAEFRQRGVRFDTEPKKEPWGWWAAILDPDGNILGLHADA